MSGAARTNLKARATTAFGWPADRETEFRQIGRLELGPEDPELRAIHALLRGAYTAWVLDVELLMDA